jgi:hypothetical protein
MRIQTQSNLAAVWRVRILLAAAFFSGSEILLWTNPTGRPLADWLIILPLYILLATVILDLFSRYRLRDFAGVMTLAGIYSLLNALLINPDTSLIEIPRTLVTRVTGAHTLLGLEMLVLFLTLTGQNFRRVALFGAVVVGLAWGTWVRWSPLETEVTYETASLETMLMLGIGGAVVILLFAAFAYNRGKTLTPQSILLNNREGMFIGLVFFGLVLLRIAQGAVDVSALVLVCVLLGLCWAILWFRRGTKLSPMLEEHFPVRPPSLLWLVTVFALLFASGVFAYNQPLTGLDEINQLTLVVYGFTLYGLAWLPAVSLLIGLRAYMRQAQSRSL